MWFNLTQRMKRRWEITATFIFLNQNENYPHLMAAASTSFFGSLSCCLPDCVFFFALWIVVDCVDESVLFCVPLRFTLESSTLEHMFMFYNEHKRARERERKIKRPPQMHEYLKLIRNQWASMSTLHRLRVNLKNSLYSFFLDSFFSTVWQHRWDVMIYVVRAHTGVIVIYAKRSRNTVQWKKDNYIPQVLHIQIIWSHTKLYENFNCNSAVVIFFLPTSCSIGWQSGWMTFFRVSFFIYCAIYLIFICNEEFGWEFNTKYSH